MSAILEPPATESPSPARAPRPWSLSRITSSGRFVPEIDGFRFVAIVSVVLFHDLGYMLQKNGMNSQVDGTPIIPLAGFDRLLSQILEAGGIGVHFFFLISGFILALPFAEHHLLAAKKPSLKSYFWRRVTRLEPPYLINMLIFTCLVAHFKHTGALESFQHFAASMTYSHSQIYGYGSPVNVVTWSLEIEIQFYILAPLLTYLFVIRNLRTRRAVLFTLILACGALNCAFAHDSFRYERSIFNSIQYFFAGFLLADVFLLNRSYLLAKHWRWDLLALLMTVVIVISLILSRGTWGPYTFYVPLCMFLFCVAGFKGPMINAFFRLPAIYLIGGMCYTLYLYFGHSDSAFAALTRPLYLHRLPVWANFPLQFAIHAVMLLALCSVLFLLIERPCMKRNWPQHLWRKIRGHPNPPS